MTFNTHTDPMKLLVLTSTIKDVELAHGMLDRNCYFFADMVMDLAKDVLGGHVEAPKKDSSGKATHLNLSPFLSGDEYKDLFRAAKDRYTENWAEFEKDVSFIFLI